jgi:hypothetical protein
VLPDREAIHNTSSALVKNQNCQDPVCFRRSTKRNDIDDIAAIVAFIRAIRPSAKADRLRLELHLPRDISRREILTPPGAVIRSGTVSSTIIKEANHG